MPFVTEFNFSRILKMFGRNIPDNIKKWQPYKKSIFFLNTIDKTNLYHFKEFCENPAIIIDNTFTPFEIKDTLEFVYEGGAPSYHKYENCEKLISDYINFKIPIEIKEKGKESIAGFRSWFKENEALFRDKPDVYQMRLLAKYQIQSSLERVNYRNSGLMYKENISLIEIEKRIDSILFNEFEYLRNNPDKQIVIRDYCKKTYLAFKSKLIDNNFTGFSDKELKTILREYFSLFVQPIIYYLKEHFKIIYNSTSEIDEKIFALLKFNKCRHCYSETYLDTSGIREEKIKELTAVFGEYEFTIEPSQFIFKNENNQRIAFIYCRVISCLDITLQNDQSGNFKTHKIEYINKENQIKYATSKIYEKDLPNIHLFKRYLTKFSINERTNQSTLITYAYEL